MATALERAVESLSDPAVALPDALRRLLVVGHRINATELTGWIRNELDGYSGAAQVPKYRDATGLPIELTFLGPYGSSRTFSVDAIDLPDRLTSWTDDFHLRAPIAEVVALSEGRAEGEPGAPLPLAWITLYRQLHKESAGVPAVNGLTIDNARVVMPRTMLRGLVDRVKSTALDIALGLEDVSPDVGDAGGPTVGDEPRLAAQVHYYMTNLYAEGSTVTVGSSAAVASAPGGVAIQVQAGDVEALLHAATAYLNAEGIEALRAAIQQDGGEPKRATRSFLRKMKRGSVGLASGITVNAAYDGLLALLGQAFPGISGGG